MARNWIENVRWFDAFNMSENRMRDFHKQMTRFAPHLLVAYAGSLHEYAKFLKNNHLKPEYPIKNVISSAEVLTSAIRKLVSEVFQKAIFDRYGNREFGPIAAECEAHDGLHINEHDMLLEIDSDDPYHIPGDIIVTYFSNRGMPFVRYNTGDRGTFAKGECACGRKTKRLQTIEGRLSDSIRTKDGKVIHGEYFTHLMYGVEGVKAFQFVQTTEREFVLRVSFNSPQNAQTRAKVSADQEGPQNTQNMQKGENAGMKENAGMLGLGNAGNQEPRTRNPQPATCNLQPPSWWQDVRAQILEMVGADADVRLEIVDEIPLLPSGKRKFTVSLVGQKNLNRT
jgi:phenylacetate-CoA ligase